MNKQVLLALAVFVFVGLILRTWRLADNPVSTYWDETAMGYDAYSVAQTGKDMHGNPWYQTIFPSYGDYKLPLYIWFTSITTKLLGPTVTAIRLPSALAGTLLILVIYLLTYEITRSTKAGLIGATLLSILPWSVHFSRVGFEANLSTLMVAMCLWCLVYGLRKPWMLLLSGIFGALGVYGYFSVRFVVPPLMVGFGLIYFRDLSRKSWLLFGFRTGSFFTFTLAYIPLTFVWGSQSIPLEHRQHFKYR
jgi:4-amino-4-deoxy-L-arabinose transferase-like glycosyltransferase